MRIQKGSSNNNIEQVQFTYRTTFKILGILKIDDLLKVQELKFFYKYRHGILPVYLLNWNIIPNYNIHSHDTRKATNIHTSMTRHEFAQKCLKHNLPHTINDTPELVLVKIITHSLHGFAYYFKKVICKDITTHVQYMIVTYVR